ncbi:hypothetical protein MSAN_02519100 [Mycena sanguinolenta]|uniref:DUF6534 domain-containing protein n=1 Tax=Mycena sanguinolenta TaxID=230812 RepID=A0A8H6TZB0_9AGAR|nr:hypothetical protein MSAN_02519100 [Mycena sanguinolenta]
MSTKVFEVLAPDVATVVGPVYIANILNWLFMGTLIMQLYTYNQLFPTDRPVLRILVYFVFLVDVVQTISLTIHGWYFAVTTWGRPALWEILPWTAAMIPIPCGLISMAVQIFYSWRIWILTSNQFFHGVAILIVVLSLMQGFAAIVPGVLLLYPPTQENLIRLHPGFSAWLAGSFAVDTLITATMTYIAKNLLTKIIHRTIQTGAASVIIAAVDLAMFVRFPDANYHVVPAYILGKVYTNSLLLNLNLRHPTAPPRLKAEVEGSEIQSLRFQDRGRSGSVHISRTTMSTGTPDSVPGLWSQKDDQTDAFPLEHVLDIRSGDMVERFDRHDAGPV